MPRSAERQPGSATVDMLNDQHAFVSLDASDSVAVSDWVGCGISHPCSVFDRWRVLTVVDGTSVVDFVTTVF